MISEPTIWVFTPCFYDSESFLKLVGELLKQMGAQCPGFRHKIVLIDDSGGQDPAIGRLSIPGDHEIVTLPYKMGHQSALVFGLRKMSTNIAETDYVITMDCDGEDSPEHAPLLLKPLMADTGNLFKVSLAARTKRRESPQFKIFYLLFKSFFWLLTGTVIRTGNFAAYRGLFLKKLIFHPYFDYCYSSSFIALPLQREYTPLARGLRYSGASKMGFLRLCSHGLTMLLPLMETVTVRAIIFSCVVFVMGLLLILSGFSLNDREWMIYTGLSSVGLSAIIGTASLILFFIFQQDRGRSISRWYEKYENSK